MTDGIVVGCAIGALLFLHRMAQSVAIDRVVPMVEEDQADRGEAAPGPYDVATATDRDVAVDRISGAFFFGAAATVGAALDRSAEHPKA